METKKVLHYLKPAHDSIVMAICPAPDGNTFFSASKDNSIKLWEVATGECLHTAEHAHEDNVNCLAISKDGTTLFSGSDDGQMKVWNINSKECIHSFKRNHEFPLKAIVNSTDDHVFACAFEDKLIKVWEVPYGMKPGSKHEGQSHSNNDPSETPAFGMKKSKKKKKELLPPPAISQLFASEIENLKKEKVSLEKQLAEAVKKYEAA